MQRHPVPDIMRSGEEDVPGFFLLLVLVGSDGGGGGLGGGKGEHQFGEERSRQLTGSIEVRSDQIYPSPNKEWQDGVNTQVKDERKEKAKETERKALPSPEWSWSVWNSNDALAWSRACFTLAGESYLPPEKAHLVSSSLEEEGGEKRVGRTQTPRSRPDSPKEGADFA